MRGETILITGGTGTFGRAFIQKALSEGVARITSVSRNAEMRYQLQQMFPDPRVCVVPGDVRFLADLQRASKAAGRIDLIIHAAAEKHITTGQQFPDYVYDVNVQGAVHVIELAAQLNAKVVALSTDKACEPVNFYGETKKEAEGLFVKAGHIVVRYGNVCGSSGSVLPLFLQQRKSGELTITDRRMTRFFMPVSDASPWQVCELPDLKQPMSAVGLVQYATRHGYGGEVFVPTIPSGTIENLAEKIGPACTIREIGIRDGEKLHEQLIAADEVSRTYRLPEGVFVVMPEPVAYMTPVESSFRHASDVDPQIILEVLEAQPCASV